MPGFLANEEGQEPVHVLIENASGSTFEEDGCVAKTVAAPIPEDTEPKATMEISSIATVPEEDAEPKATTTDISSQRASSTIWPIEHRLIGTATTSDDKAQDLSNHTATAEAANGVEAFCTGMLCLQTEGVQNEDEVDLEQNSEATETPHADLQHTEATHAESRLVKRRSKKRTEIEKLGCQTLVRGHTRKRAAPIAFNPNLPPTQSQPGTESESTRILRPAFVPYNKRLRRAEFDPAVVRSKRRESDSAGGIRVLLADLH